MAIETQVQEYLACWFQLGKQVVYLKTGEKICPTPVLCHGAYSANFQACWQRFQANPDHYYLEGSAQLLSDLLSSRWDVNPCARCSMPVPQSANGLPISVCPCHDIRNWPDFTLPLPRGPQSWLSPMRALRDRLREASDRYQAKAEEGSPS